MQDGLLQLLSPASEAQNLSAQSHRGLEVRILLGLSQRSVFFGLQSNETWCRHIAIISWRHLILYVARWGYARIHKQLSGVWSSQKSRELRSYRASPVLSGPGI